MSVTVVLGTLVGGRGPLVAGRSSRLVGAGAEADLRVRLGSRSAALRVPKARTVTVMTAVAISQMIW